MLRLVNKNHYNQQPQQQQQQKKEQTPKYGCCGPVHLLLSSVVFVSSLLIIYCPQTMMTTRNMLNHPHHHHRPQVDNKPVAAAAAGRPQWMDQALHLPWSHLSLRRTFYVISVVQDHSVPLSSDQISSSSLLAQGLAEFHFQVHLAIEKWNDTALMHYSHTLQLSILPADTFHRITSNCSLELPLEGKGLKPMYVEGVGKCKLSMPRPIFSDNNNNYNASFLAPFSHITITLDQDTLSFPASSILHFPKPVPILPLLRSTVNSSPSTPQAGTEEGYRIPEFMKGVFVETEESSPSSLLSQFKVAIFIARKFSWTKDDDLWLWWHVLLLKPDQIVINIVASMLDFDRMTQHIQEMKLSKLVTLVRSDVPADTQMTFCHLEELSIWDSYQRWQVLQP